MSRPPRKQPRKPSLAKSPPGDLVAERRAASQKAQQEYHELQGSIRKDELQDRCWYYGEGLNSVAIWDARAGNFWTIAFAEPAKPAKPQERRPVLKKEGHGSGTNETFRPIAILEPPC